VVASSHISNRRVDRGCRAVSESEQDVLVDRDELRGGAREGSQRDQRFVVQCERQPRVEKHPSRWTAPDGTERSSSDNDLELLATCGSRHADEVSRLGEGFHRPPRGDAGGSRRFDVRTRSHDSECEDGMTEMIEQVHSMHTLFAKRPTQVAQREHAHLPLHVQNPPVPMLSWSVADSIIRAAAPDGDEKVWFATTSAYREEESASKIFEKRDTTQDVNDDALLFGDDLEKLIESGFAIDTGLSCEQFESEYAGQHAYVKLFSVVETKPDGERRRVIAWPRSLNAAEQVVMKDLRDEQNARVKFDSASEVRDRGVKFTYSASLDFKKFFQQFALLVKRFFAFKFRGRVYFIATIPTGAVFPPTFANALSRAMLALSIRLANVTSLVEYDCCIDNLRLCSNNIHALWAAWNELLKLCKSLGATIGDMQPPPSEMQQPYVYLGMHFSTCEHVPTAELSTKSKIKLTSAIALINSHKRVPVVDVIALFGQTVWACIVTGYRLGNLYHVIKFIRRAQRHQMTDIVEIWPSIIETWTTTLTILIDRKFQAAPEPEAHATMYTDASDSGWGVVILDFGSRPIRVFAGQWSPEERRMHINVKELSALRIGIRTLSTLKAKQEDVVGIRIFVDNTTARAWAIRKRAPNFLANTIAGDIGAEAELSNIRITSIEYVKSERNIADKPSRRFQFI